MPEPEDPRPMLQRAGAVAQGVLAAVRPEQFDAPTPCTEWTVRQLIGHLINGNQRFTARVTGGAVPERSVAFDGADPVAAFRDSFAAFADAVADDAVLSRTFPTPFGEGPGAQLVAMRTIELTVHGWDLAVATGQPRELGPQLVRSPTRPSAPGPSRAAGPARSAPSSRCRTGPGPPTGSPPTSAGRFRRPSVRWDHGRPRGRLKIHGTRPSPSSRWRFLSGGSII